MIKISITLFILNQQKWINFRPFPASPYCYRSSSVPSLERIGSFTRHTRRGKRTENGCAPQQGRREGGVGVFNETTPEMEYLY